MGINTTNFNISVTTTLCFYKVSLSIELLVFGRIIVLNTFCFSLLSSFLPSLHLFRPLWPLHLPFPSFPFFLLVLKRFNSQLWSMKCFISSAVVFNSCLGRFKLPYAWSIECSRGLNDDHKEFFPYFLHFNLIEIV